MRVGEEPGVEWNYSGGGYTLLQLLIEEVSDQSFDRFMAERVFSPLGMNDTTFAPHGLDRAPVAENFNTDGEIEPLRRYTSLAATSLFTTANDMSRFLAAQSPRANPAGGGVLSTATLTLMREPHGRQMGVRFGAWASCSMQPTIAETSSSATTEAMSRRSTPPQD